MTRLSRIVSLVAAAIIALAASAIPASAVQVHDPGGYSIGMKNTNLGAPLRDVSAGHSAAPVSALVSARAIASGRISNRDATLAGLGDRPADGKGTSLLVITNTTAIGRAGA